MKGHWKEEEDDVTLKEGIVWIVVFTAPATLCKWNILGFYCKLTVPAAFLPAAIEVIVKSDEVLARENNWESAVKVLSGDQEVHSLPCKEQHHKVGAFDNITWSLWADGVVQLFEFLFF